MRGSLVRVAENWPQAARAQVKHLVETYGPPEIEASDRLEWRHLRDWQRVCARRDGLLEETVPYEVPRRSLTRIPSFEGRIFVDGFHKEVTAIGENEEMNRLALNLMHDVVIGAKTRGQAWEKYQRSAQALAWHWADPYMNKLQFYTDTYQLEQCKQFPAPHQHDSQLTTNSSRNRHPYSR